MDNLKDSTMASESIKVTVFGFKSNVRLIFKENLVKIDSTL